MKSDNIMSLYSKFRNFSDKFLDIIVFLFEQVNYKFGVRQFHFNGFTIEIYNDTRGPKIISDFDEEMSIYITEKILHDFCIDVMDCMKMKKFIKVISREFWIEEGGFGKNKRIVYTNICVEIGGKKSYLYLNVCGNRRFESEMENMYIESFVNFVNEKYSQENQPAI